MSKRNPESPWNPAYPATVTPEQYEQEVVAWLRASAQSLDSFVIRHRQELSGPGGDYEFDAVGKLTILGGAGLIVLVECKRCSRPVEREELLALWAKLQDVGAHKALMFATCGFQSGALDFARSRGIATITFVEGAFLYETKALGPTPPPPPWAKLPPFIGIAITREGSTIHSSWVNHEHLDSLRDWLRAPSPGV
ncbi:MAG: restriction endonuclease [Terriglobia bacterium]